MAVVALTRRHNTMESLPMTFSQVGWDDQVERLTDGFVRRKAKNPGGTKVPEIDDAGMIGPDEGVRPHRQQRVNKSIRHVHGMIIPNQGSRPCSIASSACRFATSR